MTSRIESLVEDYLNDVAERLKATNLPRDERRELLTDLRGHIDQLRTQRPAETEADMLNILDRLGSPEDVVAAARAESATAEPATTSAAATAKARRRVPLALIVVLVVVVAAALMALVLSTFVTSSTP